MQACSHRRRSESEIAHSRLRSSSTASRHSNGNSRALMETPAVRRPAGAFPRDEPDDLRPLCGPRAFGDARQHLKQQDVEPTADGFVVTPTDAAPVRAHAIVLRYDPPPLPGIE